VVRVISKNPSGVQTLDRKTDYDLDNRVTKETVNDNTNTDTTTYYYLSGAVDQGMLMSTSTKRTVNATGALSNFSQSASYAYEWWDDAKQKTVTLVASNPDNPSATADNWNASSTFNGACPGQQRSCVIRGCEWPYSHCSKAWHKR
jgi:hypothetical protein